MILDWDTGTEERHWKGWIWRHFPCPCTPNKRKLGIALRAERARSGRMIKCWACGTRTLPSGTGLRAPQRGADVQRGFRVEYTPDPSQIPSQSKREDDHAVHLMSRDSKLRAIVARRCARWAGLTLDEIGDAGARVADDASYLMLPSLKAGGVTWQKRRFRGEPKVLTLNPMPGAGRLMRPDGTEGYVLVEGWHDACAIPLSHTPLITYGESTSPEEVVSEISDGEGRFFTAFDGDQAGVIKTRRYRRALIEAGHEVTVIKMPDEKDPADLGKDWMSDLLRAGS